MPNVAYPYNGLIMERHPNIPSADKNSPETVVQAEKRLNLALQGPNMQLKKTFRFEASHVLPKHPGKCSRLHGHSWVLHVFVEGPVDEETGFVMDYAEISTAVNPVIEALDHRHLGQFEADGLEINLRSSKHGVPGLPEEFYPTSENLLLWIALQISDKLPKWSALAIEETCTSCATLTRDEWKRWWSVRHLKSSWRQMWKRVV